MVKENEKNTNIVDKNKLGKIKSIYKRGYLEWKNWDSHQFGVLTKDDEVYFSAEIKKCKFDFPENSTVLEIGFGNGTFLRYAEKKAWRVSGIELNEHLIRNAKKQGFNVYNANSIKLLNENSFDLIVAFDVLEHIANDEILDYLSQIKRLLKPNGYFLARFPNGDSPFGLTNQNGDVTHVNFLGSGKIKYLITSLSVKLEFLGGQAEPFMLGPKSKLFGRAISITAKRIINYLINVIFFPSSHIAFCSFNLIFIFKNSKKNRK